MNNKLHKYWLVLGIFLMLSTNLFCQDILFNKSADISNENRCNTILATDSDYVTIGINWDSITGNQCLLFASYNLQGILEYKKIYCDTINHFYINWANSATKTYIQPGYAYCASITDTVTTQVEDHSDILLVKYDLLGDTVFTHRYNFGYYDAGQSVIETEDGGYILCGTSETSITPYSICGILIKTDSFGNIQWSQTYNCDYSSSLATLTKTLDGGYSMGGQRRPTNQFNYSSSEVIKVDSLGEVKWSKPLGGPKDEYTVAVNCLQDGHIFAAGTYTDVQDMPDGDRQYRAYVAKLDSSDGHIIWDKKLGDFQNQISALATYENPDGTIVIGGTCYGWIDQSIFDGRQMGFIAKLSAEGDSIWFRKYFLDTANVFFTQLYSIKPTTDGGIVACGRIFYNNGNTDTWLLKTDANGCIDLSCVNGVEELDDDDFRLSIYPNPAEEYVSIDLPIMYNKGTLQVYNMQGQLVKTAFISTGGTQRFSIADMPNGIYQLVVYSNTNKILGREKLVVAR